MDPLSISVAIVGLLKAGASVTAALQDASNLPVITRAVSLEVKTITTCLGQLQYFLDGARTASQSRMSLVLADEVRVVLAECVTHFSELMEILDKLGIRQQARITRLQRLKWASKVEEFSKLLLHLQGSRTSLNLMLTTLSCVSASEAEKSSAELRELVLKSLANDQVLAQRLDEIQAQTTSYVESQSTKSTLGFRSEKASDKDDETIRPTSESGMTGHSQASPRESLSGFAFEKELRTARVYSRIRKRLSSTSLPSSTGRTRGWSVLSDLDLSMVSNISVLSLPISVAELYTSEHFPLNSRVHLKKTGISNKQATIYEDVDYSNQRIGEIASELDLAGIRELMERQRRHEEKRRALQSEELMERLQRRRSREEKRPQSDQSYNLASLNVDYDRVNTEQGDSGVVQRTETLEGSIADTTNARPSGVTEYQRWLRTHPSLVDSTTPVTARYSYKVGSAFSPRPTIRYRTSDQSI